MSLGIVDETNVLFCRNGPTIRTLDALVSVFLRELEHYDGVLLLTTNRRGTFDAVIQSTSC